MVPWWTLLVAFVLGQVIALVVLFAVVRCANALKESVNNRNAAERYDDDDPAK